MGKKKKKLPSQILTARKVRREQQLEQGISLTTKVIPNKKKYDRKQKHKKPLEELD